MKKFNILRTTTSIFQNEWGGERDGDVVYNNSPPIFIDWDYSKSVTINDITIWEQIYQSPGNFGLFISWAPYIEYYVFIFYTFNERCRKIKTFYGPDAHIEVKKILQDYGVSVDITDVYVNSNA